MVAAFEDVDENDEEFMVSSNAMPSYEENAAARNSDSEESQTGETSLLTKLEDFDSEDEDLAPVRLGETSYDEISSNHGNSQDEENEPELSYAGSHSNNLNDDDHRESIPQSLTNFNQITDSKHTGTTDIDNDLDMDGWLNSDSNDILVSLREISHINVFVFFSSGDGVLVQDGVF